MLLQFPYTRLTYPGIDNPLYVDDVEAANEAVLQGLAMAMGLGPTDFAIISGLNFDGSANYSPGWFYLNGLFYYMATPFVAGQALGGSTANAVFEAFNDGNTRPIYSLYEAQLGITPGGQFSPLFEGNMNTY